MPKSNRLATAIVVTGWLMQRRLLYHPTRISLEEGARIAAEKGFEPWRNDAGQFIGWKQTRKTTEKNGALLIVHGNAGSAIDRLDYADDLTALHPMDVYVLEYPGYGARPGSPGQKSFFEAADGAVALLKREGPIYLWGESIGTGVAAYIAGAYPDAVRGMVLTRTLRHPISKITAGRSRCFLPETTRSYRAASAARSTTRTTDRGGFGRFHRRPIMTCQSSQ
jgi:pimeloyl-ACP methyl ester carboxylesterase